MLQINLEQWLEQRLSIPCQRQLLVIHGDMSWACQHAKIVLTRLNLQNTLWVGNAGEEHRSISAKQYHQHLGKEYQAVVYNCFDGLRANALGALSGTIMQGGVMILICPPLDKWADFDDPQKNERISYGFTHLAKHSQFVEFLSEKICTDESVVLLSENGFRGSNVVLTGQCETSTTPYHNPEQQRLVESLLQLSHNNRPVPMLVTADRGRGKSSALGIAAAMMLLKGVKRVLVCAPTFSAVERLFFHAHALLPDSRLQRHSLHFEGKSIDCQPIDRILAEMPQADMLMVDEAAAIPPPLLQKLTHIYPKLVFSSTIHGYEGSGRGFELRFKPFLQSNFPGFKQQHIEQPIRWQQGDPLESFWFNALLLKSEPAAGVYNKDQACQFELVQQSRLLTEPALLAQVFSLLINSHYQTTPDDLVRLLDAPDQQLFILRQGKEMLGAALTHVEGAGKLDDIAADICQGRRRVRGHLLPQNLGLHFNEEQIINMNLLRIVRIAVEYDYQKLGLGKYLLKELSNYAKENKLDFLGSSFGATKDLLRFWTESGFQFIKLGHHKDAASGEYSAIVLSALTGKAETLQKRLLNSFQKEQLLNPDKFSPIL